MQLIKGGPKTLPETHDPETGEVYGLAYIRHDGVGYAPRLTATSDLYRVVLWIGPVPPLINSTYARDNLDVWWNTSS